jgi:hypothetical protein
MWHTQVRDRKPQTELNALGPVGRERHDREGI